MLCRGRVHDDPVRRPQGERVDIRAFTCDGIVFDVPALVRITARGGMEEVQRGDFVLFLVKLRAPRDFSNPGKFHYRLFLASRGIAAVGSLADPRMLMRVADAEGSRSWLSELDAFAHASRRRIIRSIAGSVDPSSASVLTALTVGWRDADLPELAETFSLLGLSHLLAISGLHVGFLALFAVILCSFLLCPFPRLYLRWPRWKAAAAMAIPCIWGYLLLSGFPLSGIRAAIMLSILMIALLFDRRPDPISTLALAVIIILLVWPLAFADISFQLSVAAVAGIIIVVPRANAWVRQWKCFDCSEWSGRFLFRSAELAIVSCTATVATFPLVLSSFHQWSPLGLAVNLFAVPFIGSLIFPLAIGCSLVSLIAPSFAPLGWWLLMQLLQPFFSALSLLRPMAEASLFFAAPSWLEILLFYALALWGIVLRGRRQRVGALALLLALLVVHLAPAWGHLLRDELRVVFFDVGQGDAALITFPDGRSWMIDGGGFSGSAAFDTGRDLIAPALWRLGVTELQGIIISHPHVDHYGGVASLAKLFRPREIVVSGAFPEGKEEEQRWNDVLLGLKEARVMVRELTADAELERASEDLVMQILHPRRADLQHFDTNDGSLVVSLRYRQVGFLFPGDLSRKGEELLARSGVLKHHAVLKVAHHGSKTSSHPVFLKGVRPEIAVISAGAFNAYGMPHREALQRLAESRAEVMRTDIGGAITVATDGESMRIDTHVPAK